MAARAGDVPRGVTVADPATATSAPDDDYLSCNNCESVLEGTDRLHYDGANETVTGVRDP